MTTSATKHKIEINYERLNNHTSSYITISHVMVGYVTRGYLIYKSRKGFHHVSTGEFYTLTPGIYMVLKQADSIGIFEHVTLHIDRRSLISPEFAEEVYIDPDVERMDWVYKIVIPTKLKEKLELYVPFELKDRIIYIDNDCKDIWDWSEKVYRIIES